VYRTEKVRVGVVVIARKPRKPARVAVNLH
jgi:hypothetical protein